MPCPQEDDSDGLLSAILAQGTLAEALQKALAATPSQCSGDGPMREVRVTSALFVLPFLMSPESMFMYPRTHLLVCLAPGVRGALLFDCVLSGFFRSMLRVDNTPCFWFLCKNGSGRGAGSSASFFC